MNSLNIRDALLASGRDTTTGAVNSIPLGALERGSGHTMRPFEFTKTVEVHTTTVGPLDELALT